VTGGAPKVTVAAAAGITPPAGGTVKVFVWEKDTAIPLAAAATVY
jgi:hypothetical protein